MRDKINFDSTSWVSIKDTFDRVKEKECMQIGETAEGESITFNARFDNALITEVSQKNGWVRRNIYYLDDHSIEEMYRREGI